MDISDIYQNQVSTKQISFTGGIPLPPIERDPNILNLEKNIFAKFKEIDGFCDEQPKNKDNKQTLKMFSFEDAIKDLINIKKNS